VLLPADESVALREKLNSELQGFTDIDALAVWAQRILALKNQLTTSDAQEVESAFASKLTELGDEIVSLVKPEIIAIAEVAGDGEQTTANGNSTFDREPVPKSEKPKSGPRLNGSRVPRRAATSEKGSAEDVPTETAQQLVTPFGEELRLPLDTAQQLWRHSQLRGAPAPTGVTVAAGSG